MNALMETISQNIFGIMIGVFILIIFELINPTIMPYVAYKLSHYSKAYINKLMPDKIILVRHGESEANIDHKIYNQKADWQVNLSPKGHEEALKAGEMLKSILRPHDTIECFISPYTRTRQTFQGIKKSVENRIISEIEDPRLREQEYGSHTEEEMVKIRENRKKSGQFYYRYPSGESGADVYDRASQFLDKMKRKVNIIDNSNNIGSIYLIVTHSLFMKSFIIRYFEWSIERFEQIENAKNCGIWILEKNSKGHYKLTTPLEERKN